MFFENFLETGHFTGCFTKVLKVVFPHPAATVMVVMQRAQDSKVQSE
jgi:hypothetical protein